MSPNASIVKPFSALPVTSGRSVHSGRSVLESGPAASPAERVDHPSVGHVARFMALTDTEAAEPSRSRPQRTGASAGVMSSQDTPPTPMTTRVSPGSGAAVSGTS